MQKEDLVPADTPPVLRRFAEWFCDTFEIRGICDLGYIVNITAMNLNIGDGQGRFGSGMGQDHEDPPLAARDHLVASYGTTIADNAPEVDELLDRVAQAKSTILSVLRALWTPPSRLTCCCCGASTTGRQWYNRDNGFGICRDCIDCIDMTRHTVTECVSLYGVRGITYDLPSDQP